MDSVILYYVGITIIVLSHIHMLTVSNVTPQMMKNHSYLNLFAAALIIYWFMKTKGMM